MRNTNVRVILCFCIPSIQFRLVCLVGNRQRAHFDVLFANAREIHFIISLKYIEHSMHTKYRKTKNKKKTTHSQRRSERERKIDRMCIINSKTIFNLMVVNLSSLCYGTVARCYCCCCCGCFSVADVFLLPFESFVILAFKKC